MSWRETILANIRYEELRGRAPRNERAEQPDLSFAPELAAAPAAAIETKIYESHEQMDDVLLASDQAGDG